MDDDKLFFEYLEAREAAIQGVVGHFALNNTPSETLRAIEAGTTDKNIALAARIILWQRREL